MPLRTRLLAAAIGLLLSAATACSGTAAPAAPAATSVSASAPAASAPPPAAAATATPPPREALRIPYSALSVSMLPHFIAAEAGLYEREGLDVTLDYIATSTIMTPAMLSGEVAVAVSAPETVLTSGLQGGDLMVVGAGLDRVLFWLMAAPGGGGLAELRGKRIGITRYGAVSDTIARAYLPTVGLQPERDVTLLQMGGYPEIVAALESGAVDAGVISPPNVFHARRNGMQSLADLGELDLPMYQSALVSTKRMLAQQPDVLRRVLRAYAEGWRRIGDEAIAVPALKRWTRETDDEIALETYRAAQHRFPETPLPKPEPLLRGLQALAAADPAAAQATPEQFIAGDLMAEVWAAPRP